jgi:hypothetical protein
MFLIFDETGSGARTALAPSDSPTDLSFAIPREIYLEIQANPFVIREFALVRSGATTIVERLTNIPRYDQTMAPVAPGRDGDIVLAIHWYGMAMEYASRIRKASTQEFSFCVGSILNPLCLPVKLSHNTVMQMEYILSEDLLPLRAELFAKASVFVSRPYHNFRYTYYLDF